MTGKTVRPHFNWYNHQGTQNLFDSLVTQAIQVFGQDMLYVPRRRDTFDSILGEDDTSYYDTVYGIPVYVKTAEGFAGQEAFMTNFGLEIRPQAVFSVARYQFELNVRSQEEIINRPREGDLMFFPMNNRVFEIKYVDDKPFFYQGGKLQLYDLTVELFEYSGERFNTGVPELDRIEVNFSVDIYRYAVRDRDGNIVLDRANNIATIREFGKNEDLYDPLSMNDEIQAYANNDSSTSLIWKEDNPWTNGNY